MVSVKQIILSGVALSVLSVASTASAESLFTRDRNVAVTERERPEYAPLGIRTGSFIVRPKIDLMAGYTDNVFSISEDIDPVLGDQADTFFILRPSFMAESDWNRHALRFGGYVEGYQHVDFDDQNIVNAGTFVDGKVDVTRAFALVGGLSYDQLHESRKSTNIVVPASDPIEYNLAKGYVGTQNEWGRFRARTRLDLADYDYKDADLFDGGTVSQDFRDRLEAKVLGEVGYAITRDSAAFIRAGYNTRDYDNLSPLGSRDSDGWNVQTGVDFDISRLARGSIAVGYLEQNYDNPAFQNVSGVSLDAGLEYFPTDLTTISLSASRDVRESPLLDSGGYAASELVARIDQEVARNVLVYASAGYGQDEYEDFDRTDTRYGAALGAQWFINRILSAKAEYIYETQETDQAAGATFLPKDYDTNEFFVTLTAER